MTIHERSSHTAAATKLGVRSTLIGMLINVALAMAKGTAGILGNSYALVADAIESSADVVTSFIVLLGLRLAGKPADKNHPYGHGKFEPLAAVIVSLVLFGAAGLIVAASVREILTPHHSPEPFTLLVLLVVVVIKEGLARFVGETGASIGSVAVKAEAFHHRADALTSVAAFLGISVALIGGPGYEVADDVAAVIAAGVIAVNATLLMRPALAELIDTAPDPQFAQNIRQHVTQVPGVLGTHRCMVRKVGFAYYVDLDVLCNPEASIREGHDIAHNVGDALHIAFPAIAKVLVHIEPADDYGRRNRDSMV
jgi:cation diffusion facilitator family transporter